MEEKESEVTMKLSTGEENDDHEEDNDDVFKRLFSNDRLVKSIMRFI